MSRDPDLLEPGDLGSPGGRELAAWLLLQRRGALHPERTRAALETAGSAVGALRRLGAECGLPSPEGWVESARDALVRAGARGLALGSSAYPRALATLVDAPPLLWVRGDVGCLSARSVAVVGARAATRYGRGVARRLARELAGAGLVVVSGLARGVDAEAHRGALEAGGRTVAVLACGPDLVYPPEHAALADAVVERGAVVSELAPGTPPLPHHFPFRNRVISGLSEAVVVVEARERSGSLITVAHALEQGRDVLAVPGPIDRATSAGSNRLLREGAAPLLGLEDVLRALRLPPQGETMASASEAVVSKDEPRVVRSLREEPASRDELARRLGLSAAVLARELVPLELEGRIVEDRDGRLRVRFA